jgi:hypothetical protein
MEIGVKTAYEKTNKFWCGGVCCRCVFVCRFLIVGAKVWHLHEDNVTYLLRNLQIPAKTRISIPL